MARARNIKPGFFTNDLLAEIAPLGRILFAGLWTLADREGRQEDRVKRIKAQLLPYDECDCNSLLQDLHNRGFILRYSMAGADYIQIVEWHKHQNPHIKEAESTIPGPDENSASPVQCTAFSETSPADSLNPLPLTDSLNPLPATKRAAPKDEISEDFEIAWNAYPQRPGASRKDALKAWKSRIASGVDPEKILAGVHRYSAYVLAKGTEPDFIKQPSTFFGPGDHYDSDWKVYPAQARASPSARPEKFDPTAYVNRNRKIPDERTIDIDATGEPILQMVRSAS